VSIWEQIGTVDAARTALGDGIEVVVAQGWEAGGHNYGGLPTLALVPTVVDAVAPALVLAAGGIADGRGAAAALTLGADGVWVGSRMVAKERDEIDVEGRCGLLAHLAQLKRALVIPALDNRGSIPEAHARAVEILTIISATS
jgi:enoyl-[acyl-carrier protein] reductase II